MNFGADPNLIDENLKVPSDFIKEHSPCSKEIKSLLDSKLYYIFLLII